MNKQTGNRLTHTENRLMADRGEGLGGMGKKGEELEKYGLVVTK